MALEQKHNLLTRAESTEAINGFTHVVEEELEYENQIVPPEIAGLCLNFYHLDFVLVSDIVSDVEAMSFKDLLRRRDFECMRWKRMYSAKEDGLDVAVCHRKCQGITGVLWIIETVDGNVFGAYSSKTWDSTLRHMADEESFLFLLRSNKKYPPRCFDPVDPAERVIWFQSNYFCLIGNGKAICITKDCNERGTISGVNVLRYKSPSPFYLNGDEYQTVVQNIEIFTSAESK